MASQEKSLSKYLEKRNFKETPEPTGRDAKRANNEAIFVVQKHAASHLHFDFRLEIDGVLKSWAVPKGPSIKVGVKRLAIETEDHPLDYANFEGVIPKGNYGAGEVIVWDQGIWQCQNPLAQYKKGKIEFSLEGEKLKGKWALVAMKSKGEKQKLWLLLKMKDNKESHIRLVSPDKDETSVISGKTLNGIKESNEEKADFQQNPLPLDAAKITDLESHLPQNSKKNPLPSRIACQKPTLIDIPPDGAEWIFENKLDGYRIILIKDGNDITLQTRSFLNWKDSFPNIARIASELPIDKIALDGEIVAYRENGLTDFQKLQNSIKKKESSNLIYAVFDILYWQEHDLRECALEKRKAFLKKFLDATSPPRFQYSRHIRGDAEEIFSAACNMGMEGIVAKKSASTYQAGKNLNWLKIKCAHDEEFVVGGYIEAKDNRQGFQSLLLGYFKTPQKLMYCGRVGSGFSDAELGDIRQKLNAIESDTCPFESVPDSTMKNDIHWVEPKLVAQIHFTQWTNDQILRHPSFKGLRQDKSAFEIHRESKATEKTLTSYKTNDLFDVKFTNPERILFPEASITKIDLAHFYVKIADWILPYLVNRPLSLVRCPEGADKSCFFQKHPHDLLKPPIYALEIQEKNGKKPYIFIEDVQGLIALVQYGTLEFHAWGANIDDVEHPDQMVIDLDPGPNVSWIDIINAARLLDGILNQLGLTSFVRTSGGKGLHIVTPLNQKATWEELKPFCKEVCVQIAKAYPKKFTAVMTKEKRKGRIFLDYLRNGRGATSIINFSTRARTHAPIATPIGWHELSPRLSPTKYNYSNIFRRLSSLKEDPWKGFFNLDQAVHLDMLKDSNFFLNL